MESSKDLEVDTIDSLIKENDELRDKLSKLKSHYVKLFEFAKKNSIELKPRNVPMHNVLFRLDVIFRREPLKNVNLILISVLLFSDRLTGFNLVCMSDTEEFPKKLLKKQVFKLFEKSFADTYQRNFDFLEFGIENLTVITGMLKMFVHSFVDDMIIHFYV